MSIQTIRRDFRLKNHTIPLEVSPEELFMPNQVTKLFSDAVAINLRDVVFDIGSGVGPLTIWAALEPSEHVYSVEIVPEQYQVLIRNIKSHKLEDKITAHQGSFFQPIPQGVRADVIIADVSGIAECPARALGWYPPSIPTGGKDGTEVIISLLKQATNYLTQQGRLYFPVAIGLSKDEDIMKVARATFCSLEKRVDVDFPLSEAAGADLKSKGIKVIREGETPSSYLFITARNTPTPKRAYTWKGQIYEATNPR